MISFGYKYGTPPNATTTFDVRDCFNPFHTPALRPLDGRHPDVAKAVMEGKFFKGLALANTIYDTVVELCGSEVSELEGPLRIAIGCTGGHHRSVAIAERVAHMLRDLVEIYEIEAVNLLHRNL